jgi:L-ribulose-5-phosphate 3-epimerase
MKIGINRWTMPGDWSLAECFRAARRAGFDSIEINVAEEGELTTQSSEADVKRIVASAKDAEVELSSLSTGLGWKYPLTSADRKVREQGAANIRASLQIAQWMGVDTILCVPGVVNAEIAYDVAYERAQGALKELAPEAARLQVCIGVENVWNKFLLSPLEMARFVDEIGSEWVGVYFDAGNVLVYGYPQHWINILGSRIKKVHVKDFKANIGNITAFCNPLQGDVPWAAVREALIRVGYDGYITAEVDGYRVHPELGLRHIAESLRQVFA